MHTIRGHRGNYLADAYRRKFAEGCQARFSFGLVGAKTKGHLGAKTQRGRLPLRSTGFDYNPDNNEDPKNNPDGKLDLTLDYYSHQKYLIIQGNYAGNPNAQLVFTGSSNWGALGAVNDEILVSVLGKKVARQYLRNFNFEWRPGNSRNAYTTSYLHFRVPVVRMARTARRSSPTRPSRASTSRSTRAWCTGPAPTTGRSGRATDPPVVRKRSTGGACPGCAPPRSG